MNETKCMHNVQCQVKNNVDTCICGTYFHGNVCQFIDLKGLTVSSSAYEITATSVKLMWNVVLQVDSYALVYFKKYDEHPKIYRRPMSKFLKTNNKTSWITIEGLDSGRVSYVVCVLPNDTSFANMSDASLANPLFRKREGCISALTSFGENNPYTIALYGIIAGLGVSLLAIFGIHSKYCIL